MATLRHQLVHVPCPWNLFEHALVEDGSRRVDEVWASAPGDYLNDWPAVFRL